MMTRSFFERWLTAIGLVFAVFGVVMAIAGDTEPFRMIFGPLIDSALWPEGAPDDVRAFQGWVYGAWGGTTAGFGLLIAAVVRPSLRPGGERLRQGALAAVILWFVVDAGASVAYGVWGNALLVNGPTFVLLASPLILGARLSREA